MPRIVRPSLGLGALLILSGCFGGASPAPRSFRPALAEVPRKDASPSGHELRYRSVTASSHLDERMAWRLSPVEYWFSDLLVWSEPPASFADRALAERLFEGAGFRRGATPTLPTLESQLREFCFDRDQGAAVVDLHVLLTQPGGLQVERTLRATHPSADEDPESIATALGAALSKACDAAAQLVGETLR